MTSNETMYEKFLETYQMEFGTLTIEASYKGSFHHVQKLVLLNPISLSFLNLNFDGFVDICFKLVRKYRCTPLQILDMVPQNSPMYEILATKFIQSFPTPPIIKKIPTYVECYQKLLWVTLEGSCFSEIKDDIPNHIWNNKELVLNIFQKKKSSNLEFFKDFNLDFFVDLCELYQSQSPSCLKYAKLYQEMLNKHDVHHGRYFNLLYELFRVYPTKLFREVSLDKETYRRMLMKVFYCRRLNFDHFILDFLTPIEYYKCSYQALSSGDHISYVVPQKLDDDQYYELCCLCSVVININHIDIIKLGPLFNNLIKKKMIEEMKNYSGLLNIDFSKLNLTQVEPAIKKELFETAILKNPNHINYISKDYEYYEDMMMLVVKCDLDPWITRKLKLDVDLSLAKKMLNINLDVIYHLPLSLIQENAIILLEEFKNNPKIANFLLESKIHTFSKEQYMEIIKNNYTLFICIPQNLDYYYELCLYLVENFSAIDPTILYECNHEKFSEENLKTLFLSYIRNITKIPTHDSLIPLFKKYLHIFNDDPEFIAEVLDKDPNFFKYNSKFKIEDGPTKKMLEEQAIRLLPSNFKYLSPFSQKRLSKLALSLKLSLHELNPTDIDDDDILRYITNDITYLRTVPKTCKNYKKIVRTCLFRNIASIEFMDKEHPHYLRLYYRIPNIPEAKKHVNYASLSKPLTDKQLKDPGLSKQILSIDIIKSSTFLKGKILIFLWCLKKCSDNNINMLCLSRIVKCLTLGDLL